MVKVLHKIRKTLFYAVSCVELLAAVMVAIGIIAHLFMIKQFWTFLGLEDLNSYLEYMFDALIGIELVKLLCRHDLTSMVEVLLFAVTRYLVLHHGDSVAVLLGVVSIVLLFVVRKFLFIHPETPEETARRREHFD